jgi:hypothetical protein
MLPSASCDFCEYTELMVCQVARLMWWLVGM